LLEARPSGANPAPVDAGRRPVDTDSAPPLPSGPAVDNWIAFLARLLAEERLREQKTEAA
jgi:hypothetical protein